MKAPKYAFRSRPDLPIEPFRSAEEAWFWFVRCQKKRLDGACLVDWGGATTRPCDPDDIYLVVMELKREGILKKKHLTVMGDFGFRERTPDGRDGAEVRAAKLWKTAMERLSIQLEKKGIVGDG